MTTAILDKLHWIPGLDPVADAFAGTVSSDVFEVWAEGAMFLLHIGVGTTGTSTITVEACDDITPTNTQAVPFVYRQTAAAGGDTWGAWTSSALAGYVTTAGSSKVIQVYVDAAELAEEGYGFVRLTAVESVNDPVLGGIMCALVNPRYAVQPESVID